MLEREKQRGNGGDRLKSGGKEVKRESSRGDEKEGDRER